MGCTMARLKSVTRSSKLGPEEREAAIARLKDEGARHPRRRRRHRRHRRGARRGHPRALDGACSRRATGRRGTSSRSSKLVHGGIRYLEQLDFRLVREALIERGLLLQRLAPHLVKPVRFLYPLKKRVFERLYVGAGMLLYDIFSYTGGRPPGVPHHRHLTKRQVHAGDPAPAQRRPASAASPTTTRRSTTPATWHPSPAPRRSTARTSPAGCEVEGFLKVGERVVGVKAHDLQTGEHFEIRAKQVVNATGVWTDDTQAHGRRARHSSRCARRRASTWWCRATASSRRWA